MTAAQPAALDRLDALAAERGVPVDGRCAAGAAHHAARRRAGGPAGDTRTRDELLAALALAREPESPPFMLGNGSDIVVADAGIRGLVIRNRARDL